MLIGYARVSTDDQNLDLQNDALEAAGCERIYRDKVSGARVERPGLKRAFEDIRAGDTLVVWRLDRLGRSLKDLIARAEGDLEHRGAGLKSLHEAIDTNSSGGRLVFHLFGALAEFERNLGRERTQAGLAAARSRGRLGRPVLEAAWGGPFSRPPGADGGKHWIATSGAMWWSYTAPASTPSKKSVA
jgi:DNA invertase Pin-like site-specific DNA recombinase